MHIIDLFEDAALEMQFFLREIEVTPGRWVWQFGKTSTRGTPLYVQRDYKSAKLATVAAQKLYMDPNRPSNLPRDFFADPVITKLPLGPGNPFWSE